MRSFSNRRQHWESTQLTYEGEDNVFSPYTWDIIAKGHRLIIEQCETIARQHGGPLAIVDVGCAWGDFYHKLHHVIGQYIGVEPAAGQVVRAQTGRDARLMRGIGERLLVRSGSADVVLLISCLDHCYDADKAVAEAFRVVRPGGAVIALLENRSRLSNLVRRMMGKTLDHGDHLYYFDMPDIAALVAPFGEVAWSQSYGFVLGGDRLSSHLPRGAMVAMRALGDAVGALGSPSRGQHFVMTVRRHGAAPAAPLDVLCSQCSATLDWGRPQCPACATPLHWIGPGVLDVLEGSETA